MSENKNIFSNAFSIGFSVDCKTEDGADLSQEEAHRALLIRINSALRDGELLEAIGAPFDSYQKRDEESQDCAPGHAITHVHAIHDLIMSNVEYQEIGGQRTILLADANLGQLRLQGNESYVRVSAGTMGGMDRIYRREDFLASLIDVPEEMWFASPGEVVEWKNTMLAEQFTNSRREKMK